MSGNGEMMPDRKNSDRRSYILTLSCPNRPGIVAAISQTLFELGGDIAGAQQFDERESRIFFMRVVLSLIHISEPTRP